MDALTSSYTSWFNLESILDLVGIKYILAFFFFFFYFGWSIISAITKPNFI